LLNEVKEILVTSITFLRSVVPGADKSYGVQVAKLAGVEAVITRANEILKEIESETGNGSSGRLEKRQKVIEVHPVDLL
jgi:DNA mismatch repair ATPase MutS